jgi:hypothetical protein
VARPIAASNRRGLEGIITAAGPRLRLIHHERARAAPHGEEVTQETVAVQNRLGFHDIVSKPAQQIGCAAHGSHRLGMHRRAHGRSGGDPDP